MPVAIPNIDPESKNCSKCGAEIFYARNVYGQRVPLDAEPISRYKVTRNTQDQLIADAVKVYVTHYETCREKGGR